MKNNYMVEEKIYPSTVICFFIIIWIFYPWNNEEKVLSLSYNYI